MTDRLTDTQIKAIRDGCEGVTPGPWQTLRSDPAEGVNCHWIKAQPSPALRGFSKEVAYVGGTYYADGPDVRDAAHIARCDPDTIRAAMDEIAESRAAHAAKDAEIERLTRERGEADDFIRDLVHMQSSSGWSRAAIREAAAEFLHTCGAGTSRVPTRDTSPIFAMVPDLRARAIAAEAQVKALREALRVWAEAFATGRNEPLVIAYENGQRAIRERP